MSAPTAYRAVTDLSGLELLAEIGATEQRRRAGTPIPAAAFARYCALNTELIARQSKWYDDLPFELPDGPPPEAYPGQTAIRVALILDRRRDERAARGEG